jgi:LPPG:FO 2-phospho-L-lactate transferase
LMRVTTLAGGVGAAKFLKGLVRAIDPGDVTVIGNTGDDTVIHGLHVSPDLDIVTYTLAGVVDEVRGWGICSDTTHALDQMALYGIEPWFALKDRDIGTHLARTTWLMEGVPLSEITDRIRRSLGVETRILPMSDQAVGTRVVTKAGIERPFQEYFVRFSHREPVGEIRFEGADAASPAAGVLKAIADADRIVVCPSNPLLSIGPILAIPGVREALRARRPAVFGISPLVGGRALKGPAAELMPVAGAEPSSFGVAWLYANFCGTLVIDQVDAADADRISYLGMRPVVTTTVMHSVSDAKRLAQVILDA